MESCSEPGLGGTCRDRDRDRDYADAAIDILDGVLAVIERAATDLGNIADDAVDIARTAEEGAVSLGEDFASLGRAVEKWPARLSRLTSTGWVLAQITTSYRFHDATRALRSREAAARALWRLHERNGRRFYRAAVRQGGAFVKVGQLLSARFDLLPEPWVEALSQLQDSVPPCAVDEVRPIVEADLGGPIDSLFRTFDEQPVASASIGQVYRVVTHDGGIAALKVQRPGVAELIELDLSLFEIALDSMQSLLPPTDYETIVREVRAAICEELDYENEARMMTRIAEFFEGHARIRVPRVVPGLAGRRAFASTFIEGRKITEVLEECQSRKRAGDHRAAARIDRVLGLLLECYLRQVLQAGIFQADPHPGNLHVTEGDELVLLDFGCCQRLTEERRRLYLELLQAFIARDRHRMIGLFEALGFATESGRPTTLHAFADAILSGFERSLQHGDAFVWMTREQIFEQASELLELCEEDPVTRIPSDFVMLGRVFGTLAGFFHHYQPRIDYATHVHPVLWNAL